jgi:hypothetical protein
MHDKNIPKDEKNGPVQMCEDQDPTKGECPSPPATNEVLQAEKSTQQNRTSGDEPYSVYNQTTKTFLIISVSFMAIISPLSSAVYLPAVPQIGHDLDVSPSLINLTITSYMVSFISFHHTGISMKSDASMGRYFKALLHPSSAPSLILTVVGLPILYVASYIWRQILG